MGHSKSSAPRSRSCRSSPISRDDGQGRGAARRGVPPRARLRAGGAEFLAAGREAVRGDRLGRDARIRRAVERRVTPSAAGNRGARQNINRIRIAGMHERCSLMVLKHSTERRSDEMLSALRGVC
jgi:hypothetical protein